MKYLIAAISVFSFTGSVFAQSVSGSAGGPNVITTSAPFLTISPDARHAGLGEAGVASSADANAAYWNPGKLVHITSAYGGSLSYTPWLGKIVNDMDIIYLSGFYKLNNEEAIAASMKYFNMGEVFFRDGNNNSLGDYNPRDVAFDVTYSRKLSENFSVGLSGRYIYSNLTGQFQSTTFDAKPGQSVAVDAGVYFTKPLQSAKLSQLSLGAVISNIGAKISYSDANNTNFLPINLRIGSAFKTELDPFNTITFLLDFNKLMVPTPPIRDQQGNIIPGGGRDDDRSLLSGMFGSFSDAPDGFREEMKEITTSVGIEYWYNAVFAGRLGYFHESEDKGNRKYLTVGLGFRKSNFGIDVAYLAPTNGRENALAETIRFTIMLQIPEVQSALNESVTD
jgi:Type IX secretion system protein PorV